ncbi:MAG: patatin-like phospholipase family protein [Bdellovibrionales bacterium]
MVLSKKMKPSLVLSGGGVKAAAFHLGVCLALREKGFRFAGGSPSNVAEHFTDDPMTIKTYVGSSAGSIISTFLASGYSIEAIIEAFVRGVAADQETFFRRRNSVGKERELKPITYFDIFGLNLDFGIPKKLVPRLFKKNTFIAGGLEVLLKTGFKVNGLFSTKNIEKYLRESVLESNHFSSFGVDLYIVATQLNHSRKVIFGNFNEITKRRRHQTGQLCHC